MADDGLGTCQCGCPASLHKIGYDYGRLKHTGCTVHRACTIEATAGVTR